MSAPIVDPTTGEVLTGNRDLDADELDGLDAAELRRMAEAYRAQAQGAIRDVEGLERDLRAKNRKIKTLEDELAEQRREAPEGQTVRAIFRAWVDATGRNPKTTKLGAAREKAVLARLREGHDPERVLRAVSIGVRGANVSNRDAERLALIRVMQTAAEMVGDERAAVLRRLYSDTLGKVKRYDDLELICRNEVTLERFADYADLFDPPASAPPQAALDV